MNVQEHIIIAIAIAAASAVFGIVAKLSLRDPDTQDDGVAFLMTYPTPLRSGVLAVQIVLPIAMFLLATLAPLPGKVSAPVGLLIGLGLAILIVPLVIEARGTRALITNEFIEFVSRWGGMRRIKWNEVRDVQFSASCGWLVIRSIDGTTIRIHQWLVGQRQLVAMIKTKVDASRYSTAANAMNRLSDSKRAI